MVNQRQQVYKFSSEGGQTQAAAPLSAMEQWGKLEAKERYELGAIGCGALFTAWSVANFMRGTNDGAIYLWIALLLSGLVSKATGLRTKPEVAGFALLAGLGLGLLFVVFVGVAIFFPQVKKVDPPVRPSSLSQRQRQRQAPAPLPTSTAE